MTETETRDHLELAPEVADALAEGRPVVALESTIIAHGLPRPRNLEVARAMEAAVRAAGAVPATIAVTGGLLRVGLDDGRLEWLAGAEVAKCSARDLPVAIGLGMDGATTVAGTLVVARAAGIEVMATGGLGGVHREARSSWDVSADLGALATFPGLVVAAGVKSVLDVPATLEQLETLGVTVLGWRTDRFPAFYLPDSGRPLDWRVDDVTAAAAVVRARRSVPGAAGVLLANPVPPAEALGAEEHDRVLAELLARMDADGVRGKAVTPYLLSGLAEATAGRSVAVNEVLAVANAGLGGAIAAAVAAA